MYDIQELKPLIKKILLGFSLALVLVFVWYAATHGTINISNYDGTYQLVDDATGKVTERKTDSFTSIKTGDYTIRIVNPDSQYMQQVTVPRFLQAAKIEVPEDLQRSVSRVAIKALERILPAKNGSFVSFNVTQRQNLLLQHFVDDPVGLKAKPMTIPLTSSVVESSNGRLIGFSPVLQSGSDLTPTIYNFSVDTAPQRADTIYSDANEPVLIPSSTTNNDVFGVLIRVSDNQQLDIFEGTKKINSLKDIKDASQTTDGGLLVGLSKNYVVIGKGGSFLQGDTTQEATEPDTSEKQLTLTVYRISDMKEVSRIQTDGLHAISAINITDNGQYVSLLGDQDISIYDTRDANLHYRFNSLFATNVVWLTDDKLIFDSVNNGLFLMDVAKRSSQTLFAAKNFRFSSFSVVGNKVLFTAYSNLSNEKSTLADGYSVDLNTTSKSGNELVNKLPYQDSRIKATSLNNKIYISKNNTITGPSVDENGNFELPGFKPSTTPDQKLVNDAEDLLKSLKERSSYTIVYGRGL